MAEDEQQAAARVLLMYCGKTKVPFADGVAHKRADTEGYVIDCMRQNAIWCGHARITLRADNEPALKQLMST